MDTSRPIIFHAGELVTHGHDVCVVDHNSGTDWCHVICWPSPTPYPVHQAAIHRLTFVRFALFRHPSSGVWMSGKTRGWVALLIHLFSAMLCGGSVAQSGGWWSAFALIPIVVYWIGSYKNWNGTWK